MAKRNSNGNVLFLILIAVALFAALSYAVTSSTRSSGGNTSSEKAELAAAAMMNYEVATKLAVDRMVMRGISIDDIDFAIPSDSTFNTAPYEKKLYHPQGGGLAYQQPPSSVYASYDEIQRFDFAFLANFSLISSAQAAVVAPQPIVSEGFDPGPDISTVPDAVSVKGYYAGRFNNFSWTPTAAQDVVMSVVGISKKVCEAYNSRNTGSTTIPIVPSSTKYFVNATLSNIGNTDLSATNCPACENKTALCIGESATGPFTSYNLIVSR